MLCCVCVCVCVLTLRTRDECAVCGISDFCMCLYAKSCDQNEAHPFRTASALLCTHTHARTHARTHTHAYIHTRTHTRATILAAPVLGYLRHVRENPMKAICVV